MDAGGVLSKKPGQHKHSRFFKRCAHPNGLVFRFLGESIAHTGLRKGAYVERCRQRPGRGELGLLHRIKKDACTQKFLLERFGHCHKVLRADQLALLPNILEGNELAGFPAFADQPLLAFLGLGFEGLKNRGT